MISLYDMIDNDELVYGTYRIHVVFLVGQLLSEIVLLVLTFLAMSMSGQLLQAYENQQTASQIITVILSVVALVLIISAIIDIVRWYTKVIIITDRRLIRRDGFIRLNVVDITLNRLSQVDFSQSVMGRLLNYGNMTISGGADLPPQEIRNINAPVDLRNTIEDARMGVPLERATPKQVAQPVAYTPPTPVVVPAADTPEELKVWEQFEDLHQRGYLTDEELETKRTMIFGPTGRTESNQDRDENSDDNDDGTSTRTDYARGGVDS